MQKNKLLISLLTLVLNVQLMGQQITGAQVWRPDTIYPYGVQLFTPDSTSFPSKTVLPKLDKPIVLAFWMTTCFPCRMELDAYTKLYPTWKKEAQFEIVAISLDFPQRFAQIKQVANDAGYPFPVFWDAHRAFPDFMPGGLNGLPQVFVLDKQGRIAYHKRRYAPGDELTLFEAIKSLQ